MLCILIKTFFTWQCEKVNQKGFKFHTFIGHYQVMTWQWMGLNISDCTNIFQPNSFYKASWWGALRSFRTDKCCCVQQHCRLLWLGASVVGKKFIWLVLCYGNTTAHAAVITRDFLAIATMELVIVELLWEYDQGFWRNSWNLMSYGLEQVCLSGKSVHKGVAKHMSISTTQHRLQQMKTPNQG